MSRSVDAICYNIKTQRKYHRQNTRTKTITSLVFYEGKFKVSAHARIKINVKTGEVCAGGCVVVRGVHIYPGTHGRQNCNDPMFLARKLEWYHVNEQKNKEKNNARSLERYHLNKEKINARRREHRIKTD